MNAQTTLNTNPDTNLLGTTEQGDEITTRNIHATGDLGQNIDLPALHPDLEQSENYSELYGFLKINYDDTPGTIQLWRTGTYTLTGIDTHKTLENIENRFLDELAELGIELTDNTPANISNYVAMLDMNTNREHIPLDTIAIALGLENTEYEPDLFPNVIYRPPHLNGVCLIFPSGKVTITDTDSEQDMHDVATHLRSELETFDIF